MTDLFDNAEQSPQLRPSVAVQYLFVDEAGDPTLFHSSGKAIVDTPGCAHFFMLGQLVVDNPSALAAKLEALRGEILADPYFAGVESFKPERKKTAILFHAKDDLPEVRYRVFNLLRAEAAAIRFHAVVRDKQALLRTEMERRERAPDYRYNPDTVYDALASSLFAKFHRLADQYHVCIARRGTKDRTHALQRALELAEEDFQKKFGFSRGGADAWHLKISNPTDTVCL